MKSFLLHPDRDVDPAADLPSHTLLLTDDLELATLWKAMAHGDDFVYDQERRAMLSPVTEPATISHRQHILADFLQHPTLAAAMYTIAEEAVLGEKKAYFGLFRASPETVLTRSLTVLELLMAALTRLRRIADRDPATGCQSAGLVRLFTMLREELTEDYLRAVDDQLTELRFRHGVLLSANLGPGNQGSGYVLRRPEHHSWLDRLVDGRPVGYSFQLPDRDEAGARALAELRGRGVNQVANALAQAADHILSFFTSLRSELAFYVGCLNLADRLTAKGDTFCFPVPARRGELVLNARGLYEVCLALSIDTRPVANDVSADGKTLLMMTGANQGGKSTFLRSLGLAQLMMQSGMFVAAESFTANVGDGVFTHFKREEDAAMECGKLDEELNRMSQIADVITPGSLLLCNESFAATNEREGSEIARQVIRACTEAGVKVLFVTHLYDLANSLYFQRLDGALFLRAQRGGGGRRTYRMIPGEPLPTSYGQDSFARVFGNTQPASPVLAP